MYYTVFQKEIEKQITWEDIIFDKVSDFPVISDHSSSGTITRIVDKVPETNFSLVSTISALKEFNIRNDGLFKIERHSLYEPFSIPKRSGGGYRKINKPKDNLMNTLRDLKFIIESNCGIMYHTAAYAYIKGRCPLDAVKKHQKFGSNWFLKTDFSDFFGSSSFTFVIEMLEKIYPFNLILKDEEGRKEMLRALSLCFLDNGLPQGTPISPMLSNLIMIPIDHCLNQILSQKAFCFTRYADDITVSGVEKFDYTKVVKIINGVLKEFKAPYVIKPEKTRFAAKAGPNWNLGVMLNKDNNITIGHRKKKYFKAALCNFVCDQKNGIQWLIDDVLELHGTLAYYESVEPDYFNYLIRHYNQKFKVDCIDLLKKAMSGVG